jgi:outer membrane protein assembly factor BamB
MRIRLSGIVAAVFASGILALPSSVHVVAQTEEVPKFELDRSWPKSLPNGWEFGYVMAVAVDQRDHVFVLHTIQDDYGQPIIKDKERPNDSLKLSGWYERKKKPGVTAAPPVVEFDPQGNFVRAWGGAGHGHPWTEPGTSRMFAEHSLNVDPKGNVWIVGGGHLVLKFSPEGKFLMQIGELNKTNGSNDPRYLGDPSSVAFDAKANEVYIADGYANKRIIVYDMDSGAFKRLWGRNGQKPDDSFRLAPRFIEFQGALIRDTEQHADFVHDVKVSNDGLVYGVARDGTLPIFRTDGTFVRELKTPAVLLSLAFSRDPEQYYLYGGGYDENQIAGIAAAPNIFIFRRSDMKVLGSFGPSPSQHYFAVDSKGNIFTTGLSTPRKFVLKSMPKR